ncbi:hypothetical protein LRS03_09725 [Rhizobacter sp. J219]|uniref:hypothetical protein n=1 Tax=Rhizobacter sp. J219 TaxID=2898430 RepID=UPI0021516C86|nr:hypothetical protein [Rhizobacter sp. J219]MCR5883116.1 hypothetical protein [Rhizobacter sp. J219]
MTILHRLAPLFASAMLLGACGGNGGGGAAPPPPAPQRESHLGFSPWPYDATTAAVDWTWAAIRAEGDIVSQHLEEGVPWPEALSGAAFPASFAAMLADRRARANGRKVLVQINPLNIGRDGLAQLRTDSTINAPLPAPWSGYALNHANVKTAYLHYAQRVADALAPDVLQIGIEANELREKAPALWAQYVDLHCTTYHALKAARPSLTVTVSVLAPALFPEYSSQYDLGEQQAALADLAPCTDQAVFSVHPFISGLLADSFPSTYFDTLFSRLPSAMQPKPRAISESSYPAQVWSLPVNGTTLTWNGSPAKQRQFVSTLLAAAQQHQMRYVVWFSVRDFDALWVNALGSDSLSLMWRDTGLFDESGVAREGLTPWREAMARPVRPW